MTKAKKNPWLGRAAVVAGAGALLLFAFPRSGDASEVAEAKAAVQKGALLLDVRTPEEFAAGHTTGAVNIPVGELRERIGEVGAKDRTVVVYCRSGRRSAVAKQLLEERGYEKVIDIGPMPKW